VSLIEALAGTVLLLTSGMVLWVVWEADRPEAPPAKKPAAARKPVVHELPERRAA
jgi:hypothetical protein